MEKQTVVLVSVLLGLGSACGSGTGKARHDGAVGPQGSGGTQPATGAGSGGAAGGGTAGVTALGAGGIGTGGVSTGRGGSSGAGGGGAGGTRPDASVPVTEDGGADLNTPSDGSVDSAVSSCESVGDTCVPMVDGCAVCPAGAYARTTRMGCPSTSWCCTEDVPSKNQCTQGGGICSGIFPPCPDGWTLMRSACDTGSGAMCCAPISCSQPPTQPDASAPLDTSLPPAPLAVACTKALSCLAADDVDEPGISNCVARATQLRLMDQSLFTYPMVLNDDRDWLFHFGLEQNVDCLAAADGCEAVRACLAPPQDPTICAGGSQDYLYGRRCADATHLVGCSLDVDVRVDCAKLGTKCVESPPTATGDIGLAACALPSPGGPATPEVTCEGNVAKVKLREAEYTYDCGVNDTCVAGSHAFSVDAQICKAQAPVALTCTASESTRRCDGENLVISCPDGSEQVNECLRNGRRCMLAANGELTCSPACPMNAELCINGVITYCAGPDSTAKIDCTALGFSGWKADTSVYHAWCVE